MLTLSNILKIASIQISFIQCLPMHSSMTRSQLNSHQRMFDEADLFFDYHPLPPSQVMRATNSLQLSANPPKKFTILHTNDIHAHLDEFNKFGTDCHPLDIQLNECYGGIARIKTIVDKTKQSTKDVLFFDAGDQFQGTLFYLFYKGDKISYMMNNLLKYDLMTVGNHEFDDGEAYLTKFLKSLNFPIVNSNIDLDTTTHLGGSGVLKPYHVFEKYNLGVIGFITNTTAGLTPGATHIKFLDPVGFVQKYIDELHSLGIKRIVCVSHNGYKEDQHLARNTRGISLIVGGHSHTLLHNASNDTRVMGPFPTRVTNLAGKDTFIVQAYRFGQYMGKVDLEYNDQDELTSIAGDPILLDQTIEKDQETHDKVMEWRVPFDEQTHHIVGEAMDDFPFLICKYVECAIGNLIAEAIYIDQRSVGVDVAFINDGGLRAGIAKGNITTADILTVLPFPNVVTRFNMTGQEIIESLEYVSAGRNAQNLPIVSLCHWAGLRYAYDPSYPYMQKVKMVHVINPSNRLFEPIDPFKIYLVAANNFVSDGGDNIVTARPNIRGSLLSEIVQDYIERIENVYPVVDGRIQIIET